MRRYLAALLALCMLLSLSACKNKEAMRGSASSSAQPVHIDTDDDGPGNEGFHTLDSVEDTRQPSAPAKMAPTPWQEYVADNAGEGEGTALPAFSDIGDGWELYAVSGKGGSKYPLVGAKSEGSLYDRVKTRTSARGLDIELQQGDTSALFETRMVECAALKEQMIYDWDDMFFPSFQRQKNHEEHLSDSLRSYMQNGYGIFYGENTYKIPNSSAYMRNISICVYIEYTENVFAYIEMQEKEMCQSVGELDAWAGKIRLMAEDLMSQYGIPGLEETALGPDGQIGAFAVA